MRHLLTIGALLVNAQLAAQQQFIRVYAGQPLAPDIIELASGNLLTGFFSNWWPGTCSTLLDTSGNLLHTECYLQGNTDTPWYYGFKLKRRSDNEICFTTLVDHSDTCAIINGVVYRQLLPVVGRMDSLGAILSMHAIDMGIAACYSYPIGLEVLNDNSTIIFGGNNGAFAVKTDANGQVVWAKRFLAARQIVFLKELPNGDLMAGFNFDSGGGLIARMSTYGDISWTRSFFRPRGWLSDALVLADGTMVICGTTERSVNGVPWPPPTPPKSFIAALAPDGELLWTKGVEGASPTYDQIRIELATDGDIHLLTVNNDGVSLFRMNPSSEIQWSRAYNTPGFGWATLELNSTFDNGAIIHGIIGGFFDDLFFGFLPQDYGTCLLKVDSLGQAPCFSSSTSISFTDLSPTDSSFVLNSLDGAMSIPLSLPTTSTIPIYNYDGCLFTGIAEHAMNRTTIYPNPSVGRLMIQSPTEFEPGSLIQAFDPMGKIHYQQQLRGGGNTHELDLSHLSKGTYVLRYSGSKASWHERFVLE